MSSEVAIISLLENLPRGEPFLVIKRVPACDNGKCVASEPSRHGPL